MTEPSYVVVTPVRNEASRLPQTIESMVRQTLVPMRWVIVDDGSSDATPQIIGEATKRYGWIQSVRRADRGARKAGGGVVEAFYDGYSLVSDLSWDFVVKLDGDLTFDQNYFRLCLDHFAQDARLGIGGGTVCMVDDDGESKIEYVGDPAFHVRGATKIYRRQCWSELGGLVRAPGWDTIDEVTANMKGWTTRTFHELPIIQLKGTGTADGAWRNWFKNGRGCYITGYDPVFMLARCVRRAWGWPPVIPALALGAGFWSSYAKRVPRLASDDVVRYLRRQQRRRLLGQNSIYR